jgi:hypothetical protein
MAREKTLKTVVRISSKNSASGPVVYCTVVLVPYSDILYLCGDKLSLGETVIWINGGHTIKGQKYKAYVYSYALDNNTSTNLHRGT